MFNVFRQFDRNTAVTHARFRPEISYNFFDVIRICVSEIEWGSMRGIKIGIEWKFVSCVDWSGYFGITVMS